MIETPLQLDAIRDRCRRATPGPWMQRDEVFVESAGESVRLVGITCRSTPDSSADLPAGENAEFIAHARTDVPRLVHEVERLRAALGRIAGGQVDSAAEYARQILHDSGSSTGRHDPGPGPPRDAPPRQTPPPGRGSRKTRRPEIVVTFGAPVGQGVG